VKPETEYAARQLAAAVLEGDRRDDGRFFGFEDAIDPTIAIELRGMVKAIRREFLLDGAAIAERVKEELERQLNETSLQDAIVKEVKLHVANLNRSVADTVDRQMRKYVEEQVGSALGDKWKEMRVFADRIAREAMRKVAR